MFGGKDILYRISLYLSLLVLVAVGLNLVLVLFFGSFLQVLEHVPYILLLIIPVIDATYVYGRKKAVLFLGLGFCIGLVAEIMGVLYGLPFGKYHYTLPVFKLFNIVPLDIPLYWFVITYVSFSINNSVLKLESGKDLDIKAIPLVSVLDGICAMAWDLVMDPVMVHIVKAWTWDSGGEFFDIPLSNFVGWVFVAFLISLTYRFVSRNDEYKKTHIPAIVYFELWFAIAVIILHSGHLEFLPLGTIVMFIFLILYVLNTFMLSV